MITLRSIFTFYRSFVATAIILSLCCCLIFSFWETHLEVLVVLFWFKILTYFFNIYHINLKKSKEFYYFQALGLSKTTLWVFSLSLDFFIFVFIIVLTYIIHNA